MRLHPHAIRHPWKTILLGFGLVLAAATGLPRLELRTDGAFLVPRDAPEVLHDRAIRDAFDIEDQVAVVLETDVLETGVLEAGEEATVFAPQILRLVAETTRRVAALDEVDPDEVTSLATERIRPAGGNALAFTTVLDPLPESPEAIERARREVLDMGIYRGTLLSTDEPPSATAILVGVDAEVDRAALHQRLLEIVRELEAPGVRFHVVGAPIAESILGHHILEDLATLVPIALGIMVLVFLWRYRGRSAVLLPLFEVGACLVFVFGLLGHAGVPISLPLTVLPVILTAVGVLDEVHVFDRYVRLLPDFPRPEALARALDEMASPVVKTSVTTAAGFLSFLLSPIEPVRHFGLFTAVGVLFCMAWTLTVVPAWLALDGSRLEARRSTGEAARIVAAGRWIRRHRHGVLVTAALVVATLPFGIARVEVRDSWVDGFAATSDFRRSTETVNRLFHGTHLLFVEIDTRGVSLEGALEPTSRPGELAMEIDAGPEIEPTALVGERVAIIAEPAAFAERRATTGAGPPEPKFVAEVTRAERLDDGRIRLEATLEVDAGRRRFLASRSDWSFQATGERLLDPRWLDRVERFADAVGDEIGDAGGVLSPADQVAVARFLVRGRSEAERRVGETPLENRYLATVLRRVRGESRTEEILDADHRRALVAVFLDDPDFVTVESLMESVRRRAATDLVPAGARVAFAGDVAVSQAMIDAIVSTQIRSIVFSLVGVFLVASLLGRSVFVGLLCLLPPGLAVAVDLAALGALGIPLGVATSMFAAMTIGLGVDFAIHLVERWRASGDLDEALAITGPPILTNTLVLALGFGVLLVSRVPANGRLGLFVIASVGVCLAATLGLLPALLGGREETR